jgi:hypothetical protein
VRLSYPRFTVRRMMVAVAIVAALLWSSILALRSLEYRRLATDREVVCVLLSAEIISLTEEVDEARSKGLPTSNLLIDINERKKALIEAARAASVYRERMWRPWRPIRYR